MTTLQVSASLKQTDRVFDYSPFVSSVTTLGVLFQKAVLWCTLPAGRPCNHYYTHIKEKSLIRCFFLLVPFAGNLVIWLWDCASFYKNQGIARDVKRASELIDIADTSLEKEEYATAARLYCALLDQYETLLTKQPFGQGERQVVYIRYQLAQCLAKSGYNEEALEQFQGVLTSCNKDFIPKNITKADCLSWMGMIYSKCGELGEALECDKQALELYEEYDDSGDDILNAVNNVMFDYEMLGECEQANQYFTSLLESSQGDRQAEMLYYLAECLYNLKRNEDALLYVQHAHRHFRDCDDIESLVACSSLLGAIHLELKEENNFKWASIYYEEALELHDVLGEESLMTAHYEEGAGFAYQALGEDKKAIRCFKNASIIRENLAE